MSTVTLDGKSAQVSKIEATLVKGPLGWKLKIADDSALKGVKQVPVVILVPSK